MSVFRESYSGLSTLLLSGGYDSTVLAAWAKPTRGLFVNYGQPAAEPEQIAAVAVAEKLGFPLEVISVTGLDLGSMADPIGTPGSRVVAARNTMLVSLATNRCATLICSPLESWENRVGNRMVIVGATGGDRDAYPDCRKEFFNDLSVLSEATCGVEVDAPLVEMSKAQVAELALEINAPVELSWSCYTPFPPVSMEGVGSPWSPCGECSSCVERMAVA